MANKRPPFANWILLETWIIDLDPPFDVYFTLDFEIEHCKAINELFMVAEAMVCFDNVLQYIQ